MAVDEGVRKCYHYKENCRILEVLERKLKRSSVFLLLTIGLLFNSPDIWKRKIFFSLFFSVFVLVLFYFIFFFGC